MQLPACGPTTMAVSRKHVDRRRSRRIALKYLGIKPQTRVRYQRQLKRFFRSLDTLGIPWPESWATLDKAVAEVIEEMFQEGEPHGYAGDLLSAMSRWLPGARLRLPTARLWFANWSRERSPSRALPMPPSVVRGLAGIALAVGRPDLAALLPVAFLLCACCGPEKLPGYRWRRCLSIRTGCGPASRSHLQKTTCPNSEEVVLHDPVAVRALHYTCAHRGPSEPVYRRHPRHFADELRWLGALVGFSHPRFTPYSLRRGGATWHLHTCGSLSLTTVRGRWTHERTARIYIAGAAAEWMLWQFGIRATDILQRSEVAFIRQFGGGI